VSLENNPGITGYGVTMYYDDSKLAYVSSEPGDIMPGMFNAARAFPPIKDNRYVTFSSADPMGEADSGGTLFTVKFKIIGGATGSAICGDDLKFGYFHQYDYFVSGSARAMKFDIESLLGNHLLPIVILSEAKDLSNKIYAELWR